MTAESPQPIVKLISPHDNLAKPWKPAVTYQVTERRFPDLKSERESCTFDNIQEFLKDGVGGRLPEPITEKLRFPQLDWEFVADGQSRVLLFLGKDPDLAEVTDLRNALGVVYMDIREDNKNKASQNRLPKVDFKTYEIGVKGITVDTSGQTRALDLTYREQSPLLRDRVFNVVNLAVSASQGEIAEEEEIIGDAFSSVSIEPQLFDPEVYYRRGALFTSAMWTLTGTENDDAHYRGVEFKCWGSTDNADDLCLVYSPHRSPKDGFKISKLDENDLALSFNPRKDLAYYENPAWGIVLPKILDYSK